MNYSKKRKIFWFILMIVFVAFLIVMRFVNNRIDRTEEISTEQANTENEITKNSVLILSDGSIDSSKLLLKKEQIAYNFLCDNYDLTENIDDDGMYNDMSPLLVYDNDKLSKFEYVICSGGFFDYYAGTEIGDLDSDTTTFAGYLYTNIKELSSKMPNTKFFLVSIPYYKDIKSENSTYTVADYNLAIETIAKQFDNVYYIDIATETKNNPIEMHTDGLYYEKDTNNLIYNKFKEIITKDTKE